MKSFRIKKHELAPAQRAVDAHLGAEANARWHGAHRKAYEACFSPDERNRHQEVFLKEERERIAQGKPTALNYEEFRDSALADVHQGSFESLAQNLPFYRFLLLKDVLNDPESLDTLDRLSQAAQGGDKEAQGQLRSLFEPLWNPPILGRPEMPEEERQKIIDDCRKWGPICEELNSAFKRLWKLSEYESSKLFRKEARGSLAEKHGISIENVETIEKVLQQPSRQANKSTPTTAMLHMVALAHMNRDEKTIEKIRQDYLDAHPAEKKKRKKPTTPTAEKTA